ncbi:MAG: hypothetical protein QOE70_1451 [Chthoniobacter sp.]|jgi:hypothetical protein|nr:hypothetical protein [Chthoniobacter sp.]
MKIPLVLVRVGNPAVLAFALLLNGCAGGVGDSLKLESAVLVKVPIKEPIAKSSGRGWEFRHVLEAPRTGGRAGQWYVAWNNQKPLHTAIYSPYWMSLFSRAPEIADATRVAFGAYPVLIEPNQTFSRIPSKQPPEPKPGEAVKSQYGSGTRLVISKLPMKVWSDNRQPDGGKRGQFVIDPMWHLDDEHSQLARARDRFAKPGQGIAIGHLDNGLDGRHAAAPMNLVRGDWRADAVGLLEYAQKRSRGVNAPPPLPPELTGGSHGLGTIGLLAGSWVAIDEKTVPGGRIKGYYGWLGGAPFAKVVPVRVAPWVFSASTGELAYGIDYASRVKGCDVITMSHGGSPTQAWADAVNAAYERGTAIFAAESDFISLMPDPLRPKGIILPASPVYPAGFRRVMGVTGVTADHRSYARNTLGRLLSAPAGFLDWAFRGSYGADGTSTVLLRPNRKPDPSQILRQGQLHPQPIAGYSPNVPWISVREKDGTRFADGVSLNGAGTSASTPQAAAAAALWLQKHRGEFSASEWKGWQKSEAVYQALLKTADRRGKVEPDPYLGAGSLRANDALNLSYAEIRKSKRPEGWMKVSEVPPGSLWFGKAPNDYFDGARSFWGILGLQTLQPVPLSQRAILRQERHAGETRTDALQRLYFNMMLLREWHGGDIPQKGRQEEMYSERARRKAEKAPAPSTAL